jgi:hypothetical protein
MTPLKRVFDCPAWAIFWRNSTLDGISNLSAVVSPGARTRHSNAVAFLDFTK